MTGDSNQGTLESLALGGSPHVDVCFQSLKCWAVEIGSEVVKVATGISSTGASGLEMDAWYPQKQGEMAKKHISIENLSRVFGLPCCRSAKIPEFSHRTLVGLPAHCHTIVSQTGPKQPLASQMCQILQSILVKHKCYKGYSHTKFQSKQEVNLIDLSWDHGQYGVHRTPNDRFCI